MLVLSEDHGMKGMQVLKVGLLKAPGWTHADEVGHIAHLTFEDPASHRVKANSSGSLAAGRIEKGEMAAGFEVDFFSYRTDRMGWMEEEYSGGARRTGGGGKPDRDDPRRRVSARNHVDDLRTCDTLVLHDRRCTLDVRALIGGMTSLMRREA